MLHRSRWYPALIVEIGESGFLLRFFRVFDFFELLRVEFLGGEFFLLGQFFLVDGQLMTGDAAPQGTKDGMVMGFMPGDAADHGAR